MGKHLISFLGTGDYVSCNYLLNKKRVENVKYVQEAIVKGLEWSREDKITILATEKAEGKNWKDSEGKEGLYRILANLKSKGLKATVNLVKIPEGKSEKSYGKHLKKYIKKLRRTTVS